MVYRPRDTETIYEELRDRLTGRIDKLTNFVPTSFNYVWAHDGFAEYWRRYEIALLAAQLSCYVEYAGGPVTESDLEELGIDNVDVEELNEFMDDQDLDELAKQNGISRDMGERATGYAEFEVSSDTVTIEDGLLIGTEPDSAGDYYGYRTQEQAEPDENETTVTVPIEADEVGVEYDVGSGQINYLPNPPAGIQTVTNPSAITGGQNIETNDELRERVKDAIYESSGGGTKAGIEGFIRTETDATSVRADQYPGGNASLGSNYTGPGGPGDDTSTSPFVDIIVVDGETSTVEQAIDDARPVGIQHNLVRPDVYEISVTADVSGEGIDGAQVRDNVTEYISLSELGDDIVRTKIVQRIMNANRDITNIDTLDIEIVDETHTFESGTTTYTLNKGSQLDTDGITNVTGTLNGSGHTFVEGTDYEETDDGIDWSIGGDTPDDGTEFDVTYRTVGDIPITDREIANPDKVTINTE